MSNTNNKSSISSKTIAVKKDPREDDRKEKPDCFAYRDANYCKALSVKNCKNCSFYKSIRKD